MERQWRSLRRVQSPSRGASQIFLITSDVKQMQNQWNQLMVLTYLGTLDPIYSSAKPQIIERSVMSSLSGTSLSQECYPCGVT